MLANLLTADAFSAPCWCTLKNPSAVARLLSVERYGSRWPNIPIEDLDASSVEIALGGPSTGPGRPRRLLLHKRRIHAGMVTGEAAAAVCEVCSAALWKAAPTMPVLALANDF